MDDDTLNRLTDIHSRLVEVRDWAKDNDDLEIASTLVMVGSDLNGLVVQARVEKAAIGLTTEEDTFQRLSAIDDRLLQLCDWLNDKPDVATASRLIPIADDLTRLVAETSVKRKH